MILLQVITEWHVDAIEVHQPNSGGVSDLEASSSDRGPTMTTVILVQVFLDFQFLKSTWLQGTIEANTKAELMEVLSMWHEYMVQDIENGLAPPLNKSVAQVARALPPSVSEEDLEELEFYDCDTGGSSSMQQQPMSSFRPISLVEKQDGRTRYPMTPPDLRKIQSQGTILSIFLMIIEARRIFYISCTVDDRSLDGPVLSALYSVHHTRFSDQCSGDRLCAQRVLVLAGNTAPSTPLSRPRFTP